jgi:hypothetical protein
MAGAFVVGITLMVAYPVYGPDRVTPPPAAAASAGASAVDLSSMTPRQAADRLFNRVMQAASSNDEAEVLRFLPMAIGAHDLVEDLDVDGKFHLVLLRMQRPRLPRRKRFWRNNRITSSVWPERRTPRSRWVIPRVL